MDKDLINTAWIHHKNNKRYIIVFIGVNPNGNTHSKIIGYVDSDMRYFWRSDREFKKKFKREKGFVNKSRRMWNETMCHNMVNAAILYFADKNGGRLDLDAQQLLRAAEKMGHIMMSLSDDDKVLTITGANLQ